MNLFSQRKGIKPIKSVMQINCMDAELRNGLWNSLHNYYWSRPSPGLDIYGKIYLSENRDMDILFQLIWHLYFKRPIDTLSDYWDDTYKEIRRYFFSCEWNEVYDFIEFIVNNYPIDSVNSQFMQFCNNVLEQELSAYRFVGGRITEISTQEEISEIEQALEIPIKPVKEHLKQSLDLLTDRKNPDYRNSIKEAISAVESFCKIVTKNDKAKLGDA